MNKQVEIEVDARNIHQRMAAVMQQVSYIQKNKPHGMKYSIVSHDDVTAKCRPALLENGVIYHPTNMNYTQNGNRTEVSLDLRFVNIADPKDVIEIPCLGYGVDSQDKGPGKAVSYAVKYGLLKGLGLETGDDADLSAEEHSVDDPAIHERTVQSAIQGINAEKNLDDLKAGYGHLFKTERRVAEDKRVIAAKDKKKAELANPNADLGDDQIPY